MSGRVTGNAPITEAEPSERSKVKGGCLLCQTETGWHIASSSGAKVIAAEAPIEDLVGAVAESLKQSGGPMRCAIALDRSECLFVSFSVPDSLDVKDQEGLKYELERYLPMDAESMAAHFSLDASGTRVAAIAIDGKRFVRLVDALQEAGMEVTGIIPSTALLARGALRQASDRSQFQLLIHRESTIEVLTIDGGGIRNWKQFDDASMAELWLQQSYDSLEDHTWVVVGQGQTPAGLRGEVIQCESDESSLMADSVHLILSGRWGKWPDLRSGQLAPKDPLYAVAGPLRVLALAVFLLCGLLLGAAWYRDGRVTGMSSDVLDQQRQAFQDAFPNRRVPVMLMRTVRSEHSKALGARGRGGNLRLPIAATTVLRDLYRGLELAKERGARFRLVDIAVNDGECSLTVRAKNSSEIGVIAKTLESTGFEVDPPASEQIEPSKDEPIATFQSTIVGTWVPKEVAEGGIES